MSDEKAKMRSMSRVNSKQGGLLPQIGKDITTSNGNLQSALLEEQIGSGGAGQEDGLNLESKFSQT